MVGGVVASVCSTKEYVTVLVQGKEEERGQRLCVNLQPTQDTPLIVVGDSLWWQAGFAYWTPQSRSRQDVAIPRVGYAYDPDDSPDCAYILVGTNNAPVLVFGSAYNHPHDILLLFSRYDIADRYRRFMKSLTEAKIHLWTIDKVIWCCQAERISLLVDPDVDKGHCVLIGAGHLPPNMVRNALTAFFSGSLAVLPESDNNQDGDQ